MQASPKLDLPYLMPSQAQKHVTHNEAIRMLDALVQASVLNRSLNAPPVTPAAGDCHLVAAAPTGAWSSHAGHLASWQDGSWTFHVPKPGMRVWVVDENALVIWNGTTWIALVATGSQRFEALGVHTAADTTNRLSVSSSASLFNHDSLGHRLTINKSAPAQTASVVFQDGFSGRAEIGVVGTDELRAKVSPDGSAWTDAIVVDQTSGEASFPATPTLAAPPLFNLFYDGGRLAGAPEPQGVLSASFTAPGYFQAYNGSVLSAGPKFIHNNTTHGGSAGSLTAEMSALIQKMRPGVSSSLWRYGPEFFALRNVAGSGTAIPLTVSGTTYHLAMLTAAYPIATRCSLNYWLYVESGTACLGLSATNTLFVDGVRKTAPMLVTNASGWLQVHRRLDFSGTSFIGYEINMPMLYASSASSVLVAAPVLFPGHMPARPGVNHGVISSLTVWR